MACAYGLLLIMLLREILYKFLRVQL